MTEHVDDAILCAAFRLSRRRDISLRGAIHDFRASSVENAEICREGDDGDEQIWRLRIDRCDAILEEPSDQTLRYRAKEAIAREARGGP